MNKSKKMQVERLEQNDLHKQIIKCFGSVLHAGHALGFSKQAIYCWINGSTSKPPRHKLDWGIAEHRKNISKLKKMLGD